MDESILRNSGDDSDKPDLSVKELVDAFRAAVGEKPEFGFTERERAGSDEPDPPSSDLDEGSQDSARPSRGELVEHTFAAFRKARRSPDGGRTGARDEEGSTTAGRLETEGDRGGRRAPRAEKEEKTRGGDDGFSTDDSSTDFAPDFRKALERRSVSEEGAGQDPREEPATGTKATGPSEEAAENGVDPRDRPGDGVPSSGELRVTEGTAQHDVDRPPQPDASFLWVTDRPDDDSATVSVENLDQARAQDAEALLLWGSGPKPYRILTQIRGHANLNVCLKPIFWMHRPGDESRVAQHVDGEWTRDERRALDSLRDTASAINRRVREVLGGKGRETGGLELRVLRFMATRDHEFEPQMTVENSDGFVYPKLSPLVDRSGRRGGGELVQTLSMLEERRLLSGEFVARQHACQGCGSAFLNFEERCPNCGAAHLDTQDLVHHFRCAFTGPLREFEREEDRLVCPKCDRSLKQIGVDYDKPSVVHTCQRCQEEFQEPDVQTTCYQCGQTTPPERQIHREIKSYEITALGEETAVYGLSDSLRSILERESRVLDYATFELIVESEAARIERYQRSTASLLLVQVTGLQHLRRELGQRSEEVVAEIATAFDNTLRSSDYLSARDESLYLFLLTETDESGARRAGERLEGNIEGVLGQNLQYPPGLDMAVQPLQPGVDLDSIAEEFLASRPEGN